jgi:Flp pilus assembly protein TadD
MMAATLSAPPAIARSEQGQAQTRGIYLQMIQQARVDGRSRAALAYLDDFDRNYPGDVEAEVLRINCLLDLRQVDEADAVLARLRPSDHTGRFAAEVNAVHGHVLAAHDRWGEATPFYAAAVAANPTSPMLRNALGYSLLRDHQPARALEAIRDARDLAPDDTIIRNNLLLAYAVNGRDALLAHALDAVSDPDARNALRRRIDVEAAKLRLQPALAVAAPGAITAKTIQTSAQKAY